MRFSKQIAVSRGIPRTLISFILLFGLKCISGAIAAALLLIPDPSYAQLASSATGLASSLDPSTFGDTVTFTATVAGYGRRGR
jgi:ABC-type thiamin/hydroxymethylpyrimidine transport system permease subunit